MWVYRLILFCLYDSMLSYYNQYFIQICSYIGGSNYDWKAFPFLLLYDYHMPFVFANCLSHAITLYYFIFITCFFSIYILFFHVYWILYFYLRLFNIYGYFFFLLKWVYYFIFSFVCIVCMIEMGFKD